MPAGVSVDLEKAVDYLGRACSRGHPEGCDYLAGFYRDGTGVAFNLGRAAELLGQPLEALLAEVFDAALRRLGVLR